MSYNFVSGHIPEMINTAAGFLSRVPQKPNKAIELIIRNAIPIQQTKIELKQVYQQKPTIQLISAKPQLYQTFKTRETHRTL